MSTKHARAIAEPHVEPGTALTVRFDSGQSVVVYVVEDLGEIGVGGRRLLRVSTDRDPGAADATVFDLPADLSSFRP